MTENFKFENKQRHPSTDCYTLSLEDMECMSPSELADLMEKMLDTMTADNFDLAAFDSCLEILSRKTPLPEIPNMNMDWVDFQKRLKQVISQGDSTSEKKKYSPSLRKVLRNIMVAAILTICVIGTMIIAQAAGLDILGAIARWTENTFSFGTIRSEETEDHYYSSNSETDEDEEQSRIEEKMYPALEDALIDNEITEVKAPRWIPEGYAPEKVSVVSGIYGQLFVLEAKYYTNDGKLLMFMVQKYSDEPNGQLEKNDAPVEIIESDNSLYYLVENNANYAAAWVTEHYECYIMTVESEEILKKIIYSIDN